MSISPVKVLARVARLLNLLVLGACGPQTSTHAGPVGLASGNFGADRPASSTTLDESSSSEVEEFPDAFTVGSSKEHVAFIMGTPQAIRESYSAGNETWTYGYSTVEFFQGRVKQWTNSDRTLKVRMRGDVRPSATTRPTTGVPTPTEEGQGITTTTLPGDTGSIGHSVPKPLVGITPLVVVPKPDTTSLATFHPSTEVAPEPKLVRIKPSYLPTVPAASGGGYVRGYTRKDGTYVSGHMRSRPDSSRSNNWSSKGNRNPYTGKKGYR